MLTPFEEELVVGTRFADRFSILGVVGRGSMGIVYQARHELMGRVVAIKTLRGQLQTDDRSMRRFEREARATSRMDHPHLISVHDFGLTQNRQPYLVMEFVQGSTLYDVLQKEDHLTPVRTVRILTQVCDALQHAHTQGVVHRDLKPSNLMVIEKDGEPDFVKVFDLGIAKIAFGEEEDKEPLTNTNEVCGSPIYLSPEQCKHETLGPRSDIYSLGVVMYELLTGLPPLMGETVYDTIYMHVNEDPAPLSEVRPDLLIPSRLERIVFKALAKNPDERYQTMQELKWELQASLQASDPHLKVLPPEAIMTRRRMTPGQAAASAPLPPPPRIDVAPPGTGAGGLVFQSGKTPSSLKALNTSNTPGSLPSIDGDHTPGSLRSIYGGHTSSSLRAVPGSAAAQQPGQPGPEQVVAPQPIARITAAQAALISCVASIVTTTGVAFFLLNQHPGTPTPAAASNAPAKVQQPDALPSKLQTASPAAGPAKPHHATELAVQPKFPTVADLASDAKHSPSPKLTKTQTMLAQHLKKIAALTAPHAKLASAEPAYGKERQPLQSSLLAEKLAQHSPIAAFFNWRKQFVAPGKGTLAPVPSPSRLPADRFESGTYAPAVQESPLRQEASYPTAYSLPQSVLHQAPVNSIAHASRQQVQQQVEQPVQQPAALAMASRVVSSPESASQPASAAESGNSHEMAVVLNNQGNALFNTDPAAAIRKFQEAVNIDPGYVLGRRNLARAYLNNGTALFNMRRWEEARTNYYQAVHIFSTFHTRDVQPELQAANDYLQLAVDAIKKERQ